MYGYDQHVPIILYGSGITPGEYTRPVTPADIAPTLAYLCGVTLAHAEGDVLTEALAPRARAIQRGR
jgi:phosphoglycerol transferase MdoB-like AlkP superfamily enzyme